MKRVTLDDLAKHLGLSKFSVSRALSGKPGVSERTREQVFNAAKALGYSHPAMDRPGRFQNRKVVLIIPRVDAVASPYWAVTLAGLESEAEKMGYDLSIHMVSEDARNTLSLSGYQGAIVAGRQSRGLTDAYLKADIPVTLIGHPQPLERVDCVRSESWSSGYLMGEHLFGLGHRRIAFLTDAPEDRSRQERFRGLSDAMELAGEAVDVRCLTVEPESDAKGAARAILGVGDPPTALFGATDLVAVTMAWALKEMGLEIPGHVSVAGCNNSELAKQIGLPLTTVHYQMREVGAAAMHMLHWRMEKAEPGEPARQLLLRPELITRESTGKPNATGLKRALRSALRRAKAHKMPAA